MANNHLMTWFSRNCPRPEQDKSPDLHFRERPNCSPNLLYSNSDRGAKEFLQPRMDEFNKRSDSRRKQRQSRYEIFTETVEDNQDDSINTFGDFYPVCAGIEGKQKARDECHTSSPREFESVYSPLNIPYTGLVFKNNEGIPIKLEIKEKDDAYLSGKYSTELISEDISSKIVERKTINNTTKCTMSPSSGDINISSERKQMSDKSAEKTTSKMSCVESKIQISVQTESGKEKECGAEKFKEKKSKKDEDTRMAPINKPLTNEVLRSTNDTKGEEFKNKSQKSGKVKFEVLHVEKLMPQLDTYREGSTLRLKSHISGYALKMSVGATNSRARLSSWSIFGKRKLPTPPTKDKEESKQSLVRKLLDMITFKCCRTRE